MNYKMMLNSNIQKVNIYFCYRNILFVILLLYSFVTFAQNKPILLMPNSSNQWFVVVNKSNVHVYSDPDCLKPIAKKHLQFKDQFNVTDKGYVGFEIYCEEDQRLYWIKNDDLLITNTCYRQDYVSVKASIVTYAGQEFPQNNYFDSPLNDRVLLDKARWYHIYFVYDIYPRNVKPEDSEYILLGTNPEFYYSNGDYGIDNVLLGWFQTKDILIWNTRLAFQPNLNSSATEEKKIKGKYACIWADRPSAEKYADGIAIDNQLKVSDDKDLVDNHKQLSITSYRFPITTKISNRGKLSLFEIAFAGNLFGQKILDTMMNKLSETKRLRILFVVDGTRTMHSYLVALPSSIARACKELAKNYPTYSITYGLSIFRNKIDIEGDRYKYYGSSTNPIDFEKIVHDNLTSHSISQDLPEDLFRGTKKALDDFFPDEKSEVRITILITDVKGDVYDNEAPSILGAKLRHKQSHFIAINVGNDFEEQLRGQMLQVIQKQNLSNSTFSSEYNLKTASTIYSLLKKNDDSTGLSGLYINTRDTSFYKEIIKSLITGIVEHLSNIYVHVVDGISIKKPHSKTNGLGQEYIDPDFPFDFNAEFKGIDFSNKRINVKFIKAYVINSQKSLSSPPFEPVILLSQNECYQLSVFTSDLADKILRSTDPTEVNDRIVEILKTHAGEEKMYYSVGELLQNFSIKLPVVSKLINVIRNANGRDLHSIYTMKELNGIANEIIAKGDKIRSIFHEMEVGKSSFQIGLNKFRWIPLDQIP